MIRVLLVDDQELVRAGLRGILRPQFGFEVVGECADGTEVLDAVAEHQPDIVLMDVRMPALDGVEATRAVHAEQPSIPVLALTTFDDDEALAGMLRAGAAGFVLKGVPAEQLHRAVEAVAGGGAWLDPAVTARVLAVYRAAPAGPAAAPLRSTNSPAGNGTSLPSSAKATPIPRLPDSSSSAKAPSKPTSTTSSPSSTCATGPPRSSSLTTTVWSPATGESRLSSSLGMPGFRR